MIIVFLQHTLKERLPIFLINTLLLHIPLLAFTDRCNDRETNTLAARGLEVLFFSCAVVSVFWFLVGNRFWFYILMYLEYNIVLVLCQFFGSGQKQFLVYVHTQCTIQLCGCVSFLVVAGNCSQNENPFLQKKSYWVTLL